MGDERGTDPGTIQAGGGPCAGWAEHFALMAEHGDDRLLDDGGPATTWDETEWNGDAEPVG